MHACLGMITPSSRCRALTAGMLVAALGCSAPEPPAERPAVPLDTSTHALTHATVVDPAGNPVERRDMTIIIRGGRIVTVGPTAGTTVPSGVIVRDVEGRFVTPGFWDAHVHLSQVGAGAFPLLVANGITSVRDMGSDFGQILRWRAARQAGAQIPRIIAPGPKLDGGSIIERLYFRWRTREQRVVTSPADAREAVDQLKSQGVDFIKVHNRLAPPVYDAIIDEARKVGLRVDGHLPIAGALAAAAAGQRTIEHGRGMLLCSPEIWNRIHSEPAANADAAYCAPLEIQAALFPALVRAGTWFTPTLVSWRGHGMIGDPSLPARLAALSGNSAVWPALRQHWDDMSESTPTAFERQLLGQFGTLAAEASRAGVPLLAGTDLGDPYVIPGYALHDEMALMVSAGLSPLVALRSATSEPARAFGLAASLGAIAPGQIADLVVLDADPLIDIRNTRRISAVVLNGHWLAR